MLSTMDRNNIDVIQPNAHFQTKPLVDGQSAKSPHAYTYATSPTKSANYNSPNIRYDNTSPTTYSYTTSPPPPFHNMGNMQTNSTGNMPMMQLHNNLPNMTSVFKANGGNYTTQQGSYNLADSNSWRLLPPVNGASQHASRPTQQMQQYPGAPTQQPVFSTSYPPLTSAQMSRPRELGPNPYPSMHRKRVSDGHIPSPTNSIPIKPKRKRASLEQSTLLSQIFDCTAFPSTELRTAIANQLGMTPRTVQIWFQNRRQGKRNQKIKDDVDGQTDGNRVRRADDNDVHMDETGGWNALRSAQQTKEIDYHTRLHHDAS